MKNLIKHVKGEASMITYVKKRLRLNLNFVGLFRGELGVGKSYNGISMAYQLDPTFDAERQITFDFRETMKLVNSDWFKKKKLKVLLWDEPQITISSRTWQSQVNKLVNYLLSTFRHQNIVLIFCAPYQDFLDSQTMKLLHAVFKCEGWSKKTNLSKVRPVFLQYNSEMKKTYQHSLYVIRNGRVRKMKHWDITKPPKNLIDVYEKKKTEFTTRLNKQIEDKLDELEEEKKQEPEEELWLKGSKPPTDTGRKILKCWMKGIFKQGEIGKIIGLDRTTINGAEKTLRKYGHKKELYIDKWESGTEGEVVGTSGSDSHEGHQIYLGKGQS